MRYGTAFNAYKPVHRVAIVGTGTIGAASATHYLVRGFDVMTTDTSPTAETALRSYVEAAWDAAASIGLAPDASPERLSFTADLRQALADADFDRRTHLSARSSRSSCSPTSTTRGRRTRSSRRVRRASR
ncbi:3-hydroxyacyl-CoA dehydrogenase NAD-binding domain-containing protein [Streptomyces sp. NPDC101165]|uniref:3-hydroxyacyl-CoA dehydrogenase NAD-binding domain-containing protein n=1 Tax=Streptomyces sp. NPDC101165 TaxID=3366119 RepID=UPI00381624EA